MTASQSVLDTYCGCFKLLGRPPFREPTSQKDSRGLSNRNQHFPFDIMIAFCMTYEDGCHAAVRADCQYLLSLRAAPLNGNINRMNCTPDQDAF